MFGVRSLEPAKQFVLTHVRFRMPSVLVSPFSVWALHGGWIATGTLVGLIVTIKLVGLLVVHGDYVDPFAGYEAILPGQPMSVLSSYNCPITQPRINGRIDTTHFSCSLFPQDGIIDIIHVEGSDQTITELTFYAANLNLGQVLLHWKSMARPKTNGISIDWNSDTYSIAVVETKFDYHVPFRMFSIKEMPMR